MAKTNKKEKFFNSTAKQERIEAKIDRYRNAFQSEKIQSTIDQMPKSQATLDVIEKELDGIVKNSTHESETDKWRGANYGLEAMELFLKVSKSAKDKQKVDKEEKVEEKTCPTDQMWYYIYVAT